MSDDTVTDVQVKVKPAEQVESAAGQAPEQEQGLEEASFRSIFKDDTFFMGIAPKSSFSEDGKEFRLSGYLAYKNLDEALNDLQSVMNHLIICRESRVYQRGITAGIAQATQPAEADAASSVVVSQGEENSGTLPAGESA